MQRTVCVKPSAISRSRRNHSSISPFPPSLPPSVFAIFSLSLYLSAPLRLSFAAQISSSGTLSTENLIGALSQAGVPVSRDEAEEVMAHYSIKGADILV